MWIEHDEEGREWAHTERRVGGKTVDVRVPLAEYEREQRRLHAAKEKQAADKKAAKKQQAAAEADKRRAAKLASLTPLQATLILARRGNPQCLQQLRKALDEDPGLWRTFGNLTLQAQESWLRLVAGKNLHLLESLRRHFNAMRDSLSGTNASPLERVLADRIVICSLQAAYFDAIEGQNPGGQNARLDKYRAQRHDQANRQLLAAAKTLATVRQLTARTATIQVEMIHRSADNTPVPPMIIGAHGDQPGMQDTADDRFGTETANLINRIGKLNGHNRVSERLMPAGAGVEA